MICFYNDPYRPSLGQDGKHPSILGMKAIDAWPEVWDTIKPLIDKSLQGEAIWFEDLLVPIYRNGKIEDVYWTFSYSPVIDESGKPAGVLVTCNETTDKVNNLKLLNESKHQLQFAIEATELGTWDYNPATHKLTGNERSKEMFGLPPKAEINYCTITLIYQMFFLKLKISPLSILLLLIKLKKSKSFYCTRNTTLQKLHVCLTTATLLIYPTSLKKLPGLRPPFLRQ